MIAKYDETHQGKKLRFIIGNITTKISGALYLDPGTPLDIIEIEPTVLPSELPGYLRKGGIKDGNDS
jgi:hypothetical protein